MLRRIGIGLAFIIGIGCEDNIKVGEKSVGIDTTYVLNEREYRVYISINDSEKAIRLEDFSVAPKPAYFNLKMAKRPDGSYWFKEYIKGNLPENHPLNRCSHNEAIDIMDEILSKKD